MVSGWATSPANNQQLKAKKLEGMNAGKPSRLLAPSVPALLAIHSLLLLLFY